MLDLVRAGTTRALDLAFPGVCVGCGREGLPLCPACVPALDARIDEPPGVPIGLPGDIPDSLLQVEWCASFRGTVRAALHAIKYGAEQRVAGPLGQAVARRWNRVGVGGDLIVHVPVHANRRRVRGYDQAELIARSAAQALGLPHRSILERHRATAAQFDLDRRDRASNVIGAFHVQPERHTSSELRGRWVVLVDDVLTTGATLSACATALEAAGAMGVSAITVARER